MTDALAVGDAAGVYATIDRVVEAGHDPRRFAADLLDRFRDLMVLDAVPDAVDKGMIDYAADQAERMADQSRRIGLATLVRYADITHTTLTDMRGTTSPRLMLELLSARMLLPDAAADTAAVLQRIERLERRQGMVDPVRTPAADTGRRHRPRPPSIRHRPRPPSIRHRPRQRPAGRAAARRSRASNRRNQRPGRAGWQRSQASQPPGRRRPTSRPLRRPWARHRIRPALRRLWPEVLDQVRSRSRRTRALLDNAAIATVDGTVITLGATSAPIAKMLSDEGNLSVLRESLAAVIGGGWQIAVVIDQGPAGMAPAAAVPPTNGKPAPPPAPPAPVDDDGVDEDSDEVSGLAGIGGDPEAVAMALLQDGLGARRLEGP